MEVRGQDKEIGMPGSLGYSPPNRESPSKLSPASIVSPVGDRRRDGAALDHHHHHLHHHQFNLQQPQQGQIGDPDPDRDPDPLSATIAVSGATASPISGGSIPKAAAPPPPPPHPPQSIRYRECLKNHAASMGGHVFDGCGEFMPSGEEGTLEALKCAACDCHRNFHRKEIDGESQPAANCYYTLNPNTNSSRRNTVAPPQLLPSHPPPPPHLHHQHHKYSHGLPGSPLMSPIPPMMMAFGGGGGGAPAESSSEDLNMFQSSVGMHMQPQPVFALSKKRFRTKFSQEQKDKMQEFAEKLGWKIQKQEEQEVQKFCSDVGVKRQVFKVWMHNNKQAMKKKQL